jgi:rod shape-determining protein MreB
VVIGIPSGVTEVEKRAVYDAAMLAGARETYLIEEPTASAIAVGLPIGEIGGSMIVDIGGGTTEVTVYSMGGVVTSRSLRVAGDEQDQDILQYVRNKYNLLIGERMAEEVKMQIGSAYPLDEEKIYTVRGRNLVSGLPETLELSSVEIRDAVSGSVQTIVDTIKDTLDELEPEIISDLMDIGICLSGGGANLLGLADRVSDEVRIRAWVAEDSMSCVARGAGLVLEDFDELRHWLLTLD